GGREGPRCPLSTRTSARRSPRRCRPRQCCRRAGRAVEPARLSARFLPLGKSPELRDFFQAAGRSCRLADAEIGELKQPEGCLPPPRPPIWPNVLTFLSTTSRLSRH